MKYDWILFDADHTLFDFDRAAEQSITDTMIEFGVTPVPETYPTYHKINRQCWKDFENGLIDRKTLRTIRFRKYFDLLGIKLDYDHFHDEYLMKLSDYGYFMPGAMDVLNYFRSELKLGIVTNGMKEMQRPRLIKTGIIDHFNIVIVAGEIGHSKPDREYFEVAFQHMGNPNKKKVLIVGDSLSSDIRGGNNYGISTCWYNPHGTDHDPRIKPDYEISHLDDVKKIVYGDYHL